MKFQKVSIGTARISGIGIKDKPYLCQHYLHWAFDILFHDASTKKIENITNIKVGNNKDEAKLFSNEIKNRIRDEIHIDNGSKVSLIFSETGRVRAIGAIGRDLWIDVDDKFAVKTFEDLNVVITSLKVY